MTRSPRTSWNRWPVFRDQAVLYPTDRHAPLPGLPRPFIAYGNGRSYSDVCLNEGGFLLDTRRLDKFMSFDHTSGRLTCEAGVLLDEILELIVPHGWFLPVTPGTRMITLGGAIANDVHGKNHHCAGSFGHHVLQLALRRSDGSLRICGPEREPEWFRATVGGLGLTGLIVWAEIQLVPITSPYMTLQARRFDSLAHFWALNAAAGVEWPYTVAWMDCTSTSRRKRGRGVLFCGRHVSARPGGRARPARGWRIGIDAPMSMVNRLSARAFNFAYFHARRRSANRNSHYRPFFYPLDGIEDWNRLYGPGGFFQYQCVLPPPHGAVALDAVVERIAASGMASFLAVLKTFGESPAAGLLSFARPGVTLAVDFPNRGKATHQLFRNLDDIVLDAGGALYPAKDARMPPRMFHAGYPRVAEFSRFVDPRASSSFWRRVCA